MMQEQNCEPLPPRETAVLRTLFKWVHCIEFKMHDHLCLVGDVTGMVNEDLRHRHESFHMSPREVGPVLKCFGVDRRRTRWGWLLLFDRQLEERIHRLVFKYGLDQSVDQPDHPPTDIESWSVSAESCEFCRSSGNSGPLLRRTLRGIEPEAGESIGSAGPSCTL